MVSPFGHRNKDGSSPHYPKGNYVKQQDWVLNPTDEVDALMGNAPSWILRFGIALMAGVIGLFFLLAWLIKYPDVVEAKVVLTTHNPPIRVMALSSGKISDFLVKNSEMVEKGQVLGVLENSARWQDVLFLEENLNTINDIPPLSWTLSDTLQLGNLQPSYAQLVQQWRDLSYFKTQNGVADKIANLQQQITNIKNLKKSIDKQRETLSHEVNIAKNDLKRQQQLYASGQLSASELEKYSANVLQMSRQLEILKTNDINNTIQQKQLEAQVLDLSQSKRDNNNSKTLSLSADINKLKGEIQEWKRVYLIIAPINGRVSMTQVWSPQQFVNQNDVVLTIVPENTTPSVGTGILAKAYLPLAGAGKVKGGQNVYIRLEGFPYQEFGQIEAIVKNISLVPQQENYYIEIELKNEQLKTSYGKIIPFRQETQGIARIVTDDRRFLERIFEKVTHLFKNK